MSRISRGYFPSSAGRSSETGHIAFMFTRDLPLGMMPFRSRRSGSSFSARLATPNPQLERQLKDVLHVRGYGGHDLGDALIDFVHDTTQYLGANGEMYFEIVDDGSNGDVLAGKSLELLPHGKVLRLFNKYAQLVPFKDWKKGEPKVIFIPAKKIWHLTLPSQLGSPRRQRRLIRKLKLMAEPMPKFASKDGKLGNSAQYDFMLDHKRKDLAVEYITHDWGSIPSLRQIKGTTEYYYIVHSMQFSYSQALIREHILKEINGLLARLGTKNTIKVEGLPVAKDINDAILNLQKGEIGFKEAVEVTKI